MWDNTPLLAACTAGHSEVALRLIACKANTLASNDLGATPMHYAAVEGLLNVAEALVAAAQLQGGAESTTSLVNCNFAKVYNRHLDAYTKRAPLGLAAESGFQEVASVLLSAGAELEAASPDDCRTPLWLACRHSRVAAARLFLHHGANTGAKDSQGVSVLEAAMAGGNEDLVLALVAHGVGDVNDTAGSPLRDAVRSGKRAIVEALLTHGAAVHPKPGSAGLMPLHAACEKGDEYLVSLLVKNRADPSLSDTTGLTAFDILSRRGLAGSQVAELLSLPAFAATEGSTGTTGETGHGETGGAPEVPEVIE